MFDGLTEAFSLETTLTIDQLTLRLLISAVYGGLVAAIYRWSHGRNRPDAIVLVSTLMLLSVLIAMVSMVIGESVARAFSLVGALSIVRFRTVVEDTRDTAFVIFAVIVGMAAGAGLLFVPMIGIPLVALIAMALSTRKPVAAPHQLEHKLALRMGLGRDPDALFQKVFEQHLANYHMVIVETARQGSSIDVVYMVQLQKTSSMPKLVAELNQIEGVQNVDIRLAQND